MRFRHLLAIAVCLAGATSAFAEVSMPSVFASGMVVQRDRPIHVWGLADPQEAVTVTFRGRTYQTSADSLGRWRAALEPAAAGGPFTLEVAGAANKLSFTDVLAGEVWLASGQSNMGMAVRDCNNAAAEVAASENPQIRFLKVANVTAATPAWDVKATWSSAGPKTTGGYSAAAYFFARHLQAQLKVPVAILQSAWGGTPAEAWVRGSALAADPALAHVNAYWAEVLEAYPDAMLRYKRERAEWEANGKKTAAPAEPRGPGHPHTPAALWNGMIAPLVPFGIRGAIWYQGETNTGVQRAAYYQRLMTTLITDWRRAFGQGDFPFLYVQLANYARPGTNDGWPLLREAQLKTLDVRNTGMAVAIDIGEAQDIHPKNKQDVGLRLALAARAIAYGEKLVYSGPILRQAVREGDREVRLYFDHAASGLASKTAQLEGFEAAGPDGKFSPVEARIDGQTIVVSCGDRKGAVQIRYGWADDPKAPLTNAEGLPASPFRARLL